MVSTLQPQFLPETNAEVLSRYVVQGPLAIKVVLEDLIRERALIALYGMNDAQSFVISQILRFDARYIRFDFTTDADRRAALLRGPVTVVGFLDRIKIQFTCEEPQAIEEDGFSTLLCRMPSRLSRIQRRDSFRVKPPVRQPVECVIRQTGAGERRYRVLDLSTGGVALVEPVSVTPPEIGDLWQHSRLEIPAHAPVPCDLRVRFISTNVQGDASQRRIGCEFHRPTPETQRALQVYVMEIERRARQNL